MIRHISSFLIAGFLTVGVGAQSLGGPGISGAGGGKFTNTRSGTAPFDVSPAGLTQLNSRMLTWSDQQNSPLQNPSLLSSKLDAKAPAKARRAFEKGYELLYAKDYQRAAIPLSEAIDLYPEFVAAHQSLAAAYLATSRNEEARDEFARAVVLDNRLPSSYFGLGRAELELKHYASAELAEQKAAAMLPMDLKVLSILAYAQLMNRDYPGVIDTAGQIHAHKDPGHAIVHFYAAAAWDAQNQVVKAIDELHTLLKEDSKSEGSIQARTLLARLEHDLQRSNSAPSATLSTDDIVASQRQEARKALEQQIHQETSKQEAQVIEAEAICENCAESTLPATTTRTANSTNVRDTGWTLHSNVDEVAVFFVATDHGRPVQSLRQSEITVKDDGKSPASIVAFRNENQLPLRLGLLIDSSSSVAKRFGFEQQSAAEFMKKVLNGNDDFAFAVGVSNSVRVLEDFTSDGTRIAEALNSVVPQGGTALWDGVAYAADKLAAKQETRPVARVLVVISDGQDNSSKKTLKEAIEVAEQDGVTVYTISTSDVRYISTAMLESTILGNRALKALADHSGGNSFAPGSVRNLDHSLSDLEEFIHSRYLIAYKPAMFEREDRYRTIAIGAEKDGHKLHVYARKGYYATPRDSAD
ncbi:MAG TPA: VWA domain-containing protein [Terriglobales bacterium]|nr:VWA domain-containing protein [Terriglobales bacterium]